MFFRKNRKLTKVQQYLLNRQLLLLSSDTSAQKHLDSHFPLYFKKKNQVFLWIVIVF
jgi:hypothetical protein